MATPIIRLFSGGRLPRPTQFDPRARENWFRVAPESAEALIGLARQSAEAIERTLASRARRAGVDPATQPATSDERRWRGLQEALAGRLKGDRPLHFTGDGFFPSVLFGELEKVEEETEWRSQIAFEELFRGRAGALISLLEGLAYLGPLRAAPTRFQLMSSELPTNVGAAGEHTTMLLARNQKLVREVNEWLERLEIDYRLSVEPVAAEKLGVELGDLLATTLHDTRSGIAVTPQDVRFGISQMLPVVVQLLVGRNRTVCIEQPEIHIHPRLQAELGDLLIAAASPERGSQVIVETHSEHLMLRLQRRLRERRHEWLTPAHIGVIYVNSDSRGLSQPLKLRLDEAGHFVDEWPRGFFPERVDELFSAPPSPPRRVTRRGQR